MRIGVPPSWPYATLASARNCSHEVRLTPIAPIAPFMFVSVPARRNWLNEYPPLSSSVWPCFIACLSLCACAAAASSATAHTQTAHLRISQASHPPEFSDCPPRIPRWPPKLERKSVFRTIYFRAGRIVRARQCIMPNPLGPFNASLARFRDAARKPRLFLLRLTAYHAAAKIITGDIP